MSLNPLVEQVGFVSQRSNRLEMAGGEFCGNATRCAAFYYLKGRPGKIKINVSGVRQKLSAGIDQKNNCWAQIPVKKLVKKQKYSVVILEGITQVITNGKATQNKAKAILKKLNLLNAVPQDRSDVYPKINRSN